MISRRDENTGAIRQFKAEVVDWDEHRLVYVAGGRQREIPSKQVVAVVHSRSAAHAEADEFYEAGKLPQALQSYENAIAPDVRPWIVRSLRARRVQCASGMGQYPLAVSEFLKLIRSSSQTRHFHLIPLVWENRAANRLDLDQSWLDGSDEIRSLIAASWLLIAQPDVAEPRLKQLGRSADARIAHLATAQLWRLEMLTATIDDLRRWQIAVDRMPEPLKAGPRLVAALVQRRLAMQSKTADVAMQNRAVISLMRIPILHSEQYQIAGAALAAAANMLDELGRDRESAIMQRELERDFSFSFAAAAARQEFENMNDRN